MAHHIYVEFVGNHSTLRPWIHHKTQTEIWSSSALNLSIGFNPFQCASAGLRDDVGMLRLVFHQGDKHQSCSPFFCSFQCIDSLGIWTWRQVPEQNHIIDVPLKYRTMLKYDIENTTSHDTFKCKLRCSIGGDQVMLEASKSIGTVADTQIWEHLQKIHKITNISYPHCKGFITHCGH